MRVCHHHRLSARLDRRVRPGSGQAAPSAKALGYSGKVNETLPPCPECSSELAYEMGALLVCPLCGHEWAGASAAEDDELSGDPVITDAHGTVLADGDDVTVIKGLKVKGGTDIKVGTKVRDIRLRNGVGDHDISCRVEGVTMQLKSSVVKKA